MNRSPLQGALRWALLILPFLLVLVAPRISAMPIAVAAALLAYDGPMKRSLSGMTALLVAVEIMMSSPPGLVSLPFVLTIALLRLASSVVSLPALVTTLAWSAGALVRVAFVALIIIVILSAGAVIMSAWVYGAGYIGTRLTLALEPAVLLRAWVVTMVLIGGLYRIDVPFRRQRI